MPENVEPQSLYHFSKKVLALSLAFIVINLAWYLLIVFERDTISYKLVAPRLIVAANQDVTLESPFEPDAFEASPNQAVLTGTTIRTGPNSFAELQLGQNVIRMDENTRLTLEANHFRYAGDTPRLVFSLDSGAVWVNSFDPLVVKTDRAYALFEHTIGSYSYTMPLSRVMALVGYADLQFFNPAEEPLTRFTLPLRNQVTFVDSQLVADYSRLEYSKLKKELKMGPVAQGVYDDPWVRRNLRDDSLLLISNGRIFSPHLYRVQSRWLELRRRLTFVPAVRSQLELEAVRLKLGYLLGGVHESDDMALSKSLLSEIDELISGRVDEPIVRELIESQFFGIQNADIDSVAYAVKEHLIDTLLDYKPPAFYRHYLAQMDRFLRRGEVAAAQNVLSEWLIQWKPGLRESSRAEFISQSRLYHSMALSYSDRITHTFIDRFDMLGDDRLEQSGFDENVLFEIALERLELSRALVNAGRYAMAKDYLKTSYANLGLAEKESSAAARDLFLNEANLLAERIAFAEQTLRGAAGELNESEFRDYLAAQERDRDLEERFLELVSRTTVPEALVTPPTIGEVLQRFNEERIIVLDTDVEPLPGRGFEFAIAEGRLIERTSEGAPIVFNGTYDYSSNVLYDVTVNERLLRGNFTLADFVLVAKNIDRIVLPEQIPSNDMGGVFDFLSGGDQDEAERSQLVAQDLAIRLMIRELEELSIFVNSPIQVTVLDPVQLNHFAIVSVPITDSVSKRTVRIHFNYHTGTKIAGNITSDEAALDLGTLPVEQLKDAIFAQVFATEQRVRAAGETRQLFTERGLSVSEQDLTFVDDSLRQIRFENARMRQMPIAVSGIYDREADLLVSAETDHHADRDVTFEVFLRDAAQAFVIGFLAQQSIDIGTENILTTLPADQVSIVGYVRGDKIIDFIFDAANNRLRQIQLEGVDVVVDSMSFTEFALIEGGDTTEAESEPETAPAEETEPTEEAPAEPAEEEV